MEYAERLLDYFKNARVLAPTDSKLASIEQKLDSILPYVTSKLYELEEVAEPEDPELAGLFSWGGVYYIVIHSIFRKLVLGCIEADVSNQILVVVLHVCQF